MQGLGREGLSHHHLALQFAQTAASRLALEFVLHQLPLAHQRILTEEVSSLLRRLLKERRVICHTNSHLVAYNTAIPLLAQSPTERLTAQHKRADNLLIIRTHVCRLEDEQVLRRIINTSITHLQAWRSVERDIQAHRNIIDNGVLGYDAWRGDTIQRPQPIAQRVGDGLPRGLFKYAFFGYVVRASCP